MDKAVNSQVQPVESELRAYHRKEQRRKVRNYREMNRIARKGQILFTGSSLTEHFPVAEYV